MRQAGWPSRESPSIAVLIPVFRPPLPFLRVAIDSVRQQTIETWELVLVDDGGCDPAVTQLLETMSEDPRITVLTLGENRGISGASNAGLSVVRAPWVALLDHDDFIEPNALAEILAAVEGSPDAEVIYSDRDAVDVQGVPTEVFAKPNWSPQRLLGNMYIAHLTALSTAAVRAVGGFRSEFDGAQDHDLVLRITERGRPVVHVPKVLYHWRQHGISTAMAPSAKPYAADAGRRAVADHLLRRAIGGRVRLSPYPGSYLIDLDPLPCLVSIVIPSRGGVSSVRGRNVCMVVEAVRSIVSRQYIVEFELVIVYDTDGPLEYLEELHRIAGARLRPIPFDGPFNFSAKVNMGAHAAQGEVLVILNDDVEVVTDRWLDQLAALAQQPDIGAVGAKLLYEDGTVQHAGHCFAGGEVRHVAQGQHDGPGPFASHIIDREVVGVTAACLAQRREVWLRVGGFDVNLPNNFNDVDYCNRIRSHGFRIVQANSVVLHHFESRTRAARARAQAWEAERIIGRLGDQLRESDPYTTTGRGGRRSVRQRVQAGRAVVEAEGWKAFAAKVRKRLRSRLR